MELQDGFIVGIFNYCDSWCEACAFTSRCRVFASLVEHEAEHDPALKPVTDAPLPPEEDDPEPPPWTEATIQAMNEASLAGERPPERAPLPHEHQAIQARARGYGLHLHHWIATNHSNRTSHPHDPLAVVGWFSHFIGSKVYQALRGLADDHADPGWPADYDGSAKIALIGIERSHAAWLDLIAAGRVPGATAEPFIADLVWLGDALERVFPRARGFVRPGFDEPDEIAKLETE